MMVFTTVTYFETNKYITVSKYTVECCLIYTQTKKIEVDTVKLRKLPLYVRVTIDTAAMCLSLWIR